MANTAEQIAALVTERQGYIDTGRPDRAKQCEAEITRLNAILEDEPPEVDEVVDVALVRAAQELEALRTEQANYTRAGKDDRAKGCGAEIARLIKLFPALAPAKAPRPAPGTQEATVPAAPAGR